MKYFIWDLDGTLFNTYPGMIKAFCQAVEFFGIEYDLSKVKQLVMKSVDFAADYYSTDQIDQKSIKKKYSEIETTLPLSSKEPFDGLIDTLSAIKQSGGGSFILTHRGLSTLDIIKHWDIEHLITETVTKANGFKRKPDPEAFNYLIEKYNLDKDKTLGVGDRDIDLLASNGAGIRSCFFNTNNLNMEKCWDYEIKSLTDIMDYLD